MAPDDPPTEDAIPTGKQPRNPTQAEQSGSAPKVSLTAGGKPAKPGRPNEVLPIDHPEFDNHEEVVILRDPLARLSAIIAVHSTVSGPGVGGCRMKAYASGTAALKDALRLSRAMTYKSAMLNLPAGGAKAVIIGDPKTEKTKDLLVAFGRGVEKMDGRYVTAEDADIEPADPEFIAQGTRFVIGRVGGPWPSGDPFPVTARGVVAGMKICAERFNDDRGPDLNGRKIAILGAGKVGGEVARLASREGAHIIVADLKPERAKAVAHETGGQAVEIDAIWDKDVDIFSPNTLGGSLSEATVRRLRAKAVAGAENNPLLDDEAGDLLAVARILYAPDYIINAGGLINCFAELRCIRGEAKKYEEDWVNAKLLEIETNLRHVFKLAAETGRAPHTVAEEEARRRVANASAARSTPSP